VLKLALEGNLPELQEETPEALANVMPSAGIEIPQPIAHQ
jgi:ATP-dependent Lon protease